MATGTQIVTSVTVINSLLGFNGVSLTGYTTSALTTIAAGSKLEIGGAFFHWATAETPVASSWTAITTATTCYLKCTPSGSAGTQISTARWSAVTPVWSESKQGWYASAASVARVVASAYKLSATQQMTKTLYVKGRDVIFHKKYNIGDWNMDTAGTVVVSLYSERAIFLEAFIINDAGTYSYPIDYAEGAGTHPAGDCYYNIGNRTAGLARVTGLFFDGVNFNATSYNRGYVLMTYEG